MKKLTFFVALIICFGFQSISQVVIPENVMEGFSKKFPAAKKVKWEKENDAEFEASFKMDGKTMSANFDNNGNWLETEWDVKVKDLPKVVTDAVYQQYPCFEIEGAEYCESPGFTGYEMEIEKCKRKVEEEKEIRVSKDGQSIEELKEEAGEESED